MPVRSLGRSLADMKARPFWRLLAAEQGPVYMAIMRLRLLDANAGVSASTLYAQIERDIELLNDANFKMGNTAKECVKEWVDKQWLTRRLPEGAKEEEFELTPEAATAIRFVTGQNERHAGLTESRLATVLQQLENLVQATDDNPIERRRRLEEEQARIAEELKQLDHSVPRTLPPETACERLRDILSLTMGLPDEFLRVRDEIEQLHRALREKIVKQSGSSGEILDTVFRGVEDVRQTAAGRSFEAFWGMLANPRQRYAIDTAIETLGGRVALTGMEEEDWRFLDRLTGTLMERARRVHEVIGAFSHSLRQFVQSREFREQRALRNLLDNARQVALDLKEILPPQAALDDRADLALTSANLSSVGAWVLYDPEDCVLDARMDEGAASDLDSATIRQWIDQADIDWATLERQIDMVLRTHPATSISIAGVLNEFPAQQGLGSVVGLLALAFQRNAIRGADGALERVEWHAENGDVRAAHIPLFIFTRSVPDES